MTASEISSQLRERLDELPVSILAEYLAGRLELDDGEQVMTIALKDGRYQRLLPRRRPSRASRASSRTA